MDIKERMQSVLKAEAEAISAININDDYVSAVEVMMSCKGKILTTGIGKAGHIAKKFAATLCSTATPADFIHPAEAAHGDLGLVGANDVMIAFSTSGKSREVLEILEMSRHLGVDKIIGVTSHLDSELRQHSDLILDMGTIVEP
ncbi:MAG: SIS domain-containing protein, partial [Pseudomonadales bacterium]|nr:SIS domain-containing protein [Pseudomonadales bacterium]